MLCWANQDDWVMVESSDKTWYIGDQSGKPLQCSCLENPMNSMVVGKEALIGRLVLEYLENQKNNLLKLICEFSNISNIN